MLDSVTLWRSQLTRWALGYTENGEGEFLLLEHLTCKRGPIEIGQVTQDGPTLDQILTAVETHRCPTAPPVTPQLTEAPL